MGDDERTFISAQLDHLITGQAQLREDFKDFKKDADGIHGDLYCKVTTLLTFQAAQLERNKQRDELAREGIQSDQGKWMQWTMIIAALGGGLTALHFLVNVAERLFRVQ